MRHASTQFRDTFNVAPTKIIEERPECVATFLAWLLPKEPILAQCMEVDMQQRNLNAKATKAAFATLRNRTHRVLRHVDLVMLKKSLFLFYKIKKYPYIVEHLSLIHI